MTEKYLRRVYGIEGDDAVRAYYDTWAATYETEVGENGYATPGRCAAALVAAGCDPGARLLDMGCGTGLSGAAFAAHGFTRIDGCDLSPGMLAEAAKRGVYTSLTAPDALPDTRWDAVAAVGVIGAGAAPLSLMDTCLDHLRPGGLFVFSFNDKSLAIPDYPAKLEALKADGTARLMFEERGPHLPAMGIESIVYVFAKAK